MERVAVFPGSFDPCTVGHEAIVRRGISLFDKVVVALGANPQKNNLFPIEKRFEWLKKIFADDPKIEVIKYDCLTIELCKQQNANFILRGLRTSADFEYEKIIAQVNKKMAPDIETVFLLTAPEHTAITSTIVREVIKYGGDTSQFLPAQIKI